MRRRRCLYFEGGKTIGNRLPPRNWTVIRIYENPKSLTAQDAGFIPNCVYDPADPVSRRELKWDTPSIASLPQMSNYVLVVWSFDQEEPV